MLPTLLQSQALKSAAKQLSDAHAEVWDVALFGSTARGKSDARDADVAVLLSVPCAAGKKLSLAQELKERLEEALPSLTPDVKAVDLGDILDEQFLARQGIIAESYLLLRKKHLAALLGFRTFAHITYSLQGLTASQKKMLYYALQGRRGSAGVLRDAGGALVSRQLLKVPIESSAAIEELLRLHHVAFTVEFAMEYGKRGSLEGGRA